MPFAVGPGPSGPVCGRASVIVVPAIFNPFINIAMHLIEPPWIWLERVNGQSFSAILAFHSANKKTREVFREGWELEGRDAPHVDHITDDLAGFLRRLVTAR